MAFELQFFGATERVTGSLYVLRAGPHTLLLECGLVQGTTEEELRNRESFPVNVAQIDAVVKKNGARQIDASRSSYPRKVATYAPDTTWAVCMINLVSNPSP